MSNAFFSLLRHTLAQDFAAFPVAFPGRSKPAPVCSIGARDGAIKTSRNALHGNTSRRTRNGCGGRRWHHLLAGMVGCGPKDLRDWFIAWLIYCLVDLLFGRYFCCGRYCTILLRLHIRFPSPPVVVSFARSLARRASPCLSLHRLARSLVRSLARVNHLHSNLGSGASKSSVLQGHASQVQVQRRPFGAAYTHTHHGGNGPPTPIRHHRPPRGLHGSGERPQQQQGICTKWAIEPGCLRSFHVLIQRRSTATAGHAAHLANNTVN